MSNYNVMAEDFVQRLYETSTGLEPDFDREVFNYNHNLLTNPAASEYGAHLENGVLQHRKIKSSLKRRDGKVLDTTTCMAIAHSKGGSITYFMMVIETLDGSFRSSTMNVGGRFSDPYATLDDVVARIECNHHMLIPLRFVRKSADDTKRLAKLVREYILPTRPLPTATLSERLSYYMHSAIAMMRG